MHDWPIHVIPNALDTEVFKPLDRTFARNTLNLPPDGKIVLFGAPGGMEDKRKGGDLLVAALNKIGPAVDDLTALSYKMTEALYSTLGGTDGS